MIIGVQEDELGIRLVSQADQNQDRISSQTGGRDGNPHPVLIEQVSFSVTSSKPIAYSIVLSPCVSLQPKCTSLHLTDRSKL